MSYHQRHFHYPPYWDASICWLRHPIVLTSCALRAVAFRWSYENHHPTFLLSVNLQLWPAFERFTPAPEAICWPQLITPHRDKEGYTSPFAGRKNYELYQAQGPTTTLFYRKHIHLFSWLQNISISRSLLFSLTIQFRSGIDRYSSTPYLHEN